MKHSEYAAIAGINWSALKHMRESPIAYLTAKQAPQKDSDALTLGRLMHAMVFEPLVVSEEYAIWDGDRRGKEWAEFKAKNEGLTIVKVEAYEEAKAMAAAIRNHTLVAPYLSGGIFERPVFWTDPATGLQCKARPDWLRPASRALIDLKSCKSIEGRQFGNAAARFGYHCQLAHYAAGVEADLGWRPDRQILIAVEKSAPYDVGVFELDEEAKYAGAQEVAELLGKVRSHTDSDSWPGRYTEEQALQLPAWMFLEDDDADADGLGLIVGD